MLHKLHLFSFLQIFHWESTNNLCCAKILDFPTNLLELWILCQAKDMLPDVVRGLCHHLWVALILVCTSLLSLCKSLLQKRFEMCNNRYLFTSLPQFPWDIIYSYFRYPFFLLNVSLFSVIGLFGSFEKWVFVQCNKYLKESNYILLLLCSYSLAH